jgi:uncharacterized protein YgiM (DUF1202 family)
MFGFRAPSITRRAALGAFGSLAAMAVAAQMLAALTNPTASVNTGRLNVREGPSAGYLVIATVSYGTDVELLGRNADASWAQVRLATGQVGWASTLYLSSQSMFNDLPIVSNTAEPYGYVSTGRLNVRTGPGVGFPIIQTLTQYDTIAIVGLSPDGNWMLIRAFSKLGWVNAGFIISSVGANLPRIDPATVTTAPAMGPVPIFGTGLSIPATLNVYQLPSITSPVLRVIGTGTGLNLAGRDATLGWVKVVLPDGTIGWVNTNNIGLSVYVEDLPVIAQ